ncbi:MAG: hypothetical protein LQ350_007851 [Teloschistes chrysophthalmus]|nr:MAG: hypothetical protein LQ350_007851 [Niorma chrysophthalma]
MPKKRNRVPFHKPQSSVHPSISRTSQQNRNHGSPHQDKHDDTSVNDLLQHLRVSQAPSPTSPGISTGSRPDVNPQTVHPSLIDLLQIPETPPLRPRPGSQISRMQARRRPPGPAAPKSWLESGSGRAGSSRQIGRDGMRQQHQRPSPDRPDGTTTATTLPDLHTPPPRSLQHQVFKSIARNWEWHLQHDQYYLATLMVRHKQILISYVAWYSPHGIDLPSLEAIFLDDESLCEGATGAEGLTHLDLPTAAGRSLTIHDLKHLLTHKRTTTKIRDGGVERDRASSSRDWDGDDNGVTRDDDVWRDRTAAVVPSLAAADKARKKRTGKLVFEHGWKGWWIEDCIRFCKER